MATYDTTNIEDVIQNNPIVEKLPFQLKLTKTTLLDPATKICHVTLTESIEGKIRGFTFLHSVSQEVQNRPAEDCR